MIVQQSLSDVTGMLFRRRRAMAYTAGAILALGGAYLLVATPKYRSEASVVVRFDPASVPVTNMARDSSPSVTAQSDRHEVVLAHADILSSPDLAREVIESVGLGVAYPKIAADPPSRGTPMDAALRTFKKGLVVDPEQQGDVINVTFMHPDPALAQTMLRKLIEDYQKRESQVFSSSEFGFQRQQADQAERRVKQAQIALSSFKAEHDISDFGDQMNGLLKQRDDLQSDMHAQEVSLRQAEQRRDQLQQSLAQVPRSLTSSVNGEKYHSLDDAQDKLQDLRQKEREMLTNYNPHSPMLNELHSSIAAAQAAVSSRSGEVGGRGANSPNVVYQNIQTDLIRAMAETRAGAQSLSVMHDQLAALNHQIDELEHSRSGLNDRIRELEIADGAYRSLALHLEDSRVAANRLRDGISHGAVITMPNLPYKSANPRYGVMIVVIAMGSVLGAIGMAYLLEFLDDRLFSAEQVARGCGLPVLATFRE